MGDKALFTEKEAAILRYLDSTGFRFVSPTEIGINVGNKHRGAASSWACPALIRLREHGILERNEKGCYRMRMKDHAFAD